MTDPTNTNLDVLKSMINHPAGRGSGERPGDWRPPARPGELATCEGRHRKSVVIPASTSCHYRGPHGDDHRVGHIDHRKDAAPGLTVFDAVGLILAIVATVGIVLTVTAATWHIFGPVVGLLAGGACAWLIHITITRMEY